MLFRSPHDFKEEECARCHLEDPRGKKSPLPLVAPEKELCMSCHKPLDATLSHPVDVEPEHVRVPVDMPLSKEGYITCSTCHDIHSSFRTPFGAKSHFLRRRVSGRQFCIVCHKENDVTTAGTHSGVIQQAHFKSRFFVMDKTRPIDSVSSECLTCHDGSVGKLSVIGVGIWTHGENFIGYDAGLHPVGIDYEDARKRSGGDRKSTRLNSSHTDISRMPSSA